MGEQLVAWLKFTSDNWGDYGLLYPSLGLPVWAARWSCEGWQAASERGV